MFRKNRKNYTGEEKVNILRRHLVDHVPISDLCDEYKLHPTLFYRWQKQFFDKGAAAFANDRKDDSAHLDKMAALEKKLALKNEVLSELMEEHIKLKKELGEL